MAWRSPFYRGGVSFPPDELMLELARVTQRVYLPEFLPDENGPLDLPGSNAPDRGPGISECYGTVRYGTLLEALIYEARSFVTLTGKDAVMVHRQAEQWLPERTAKSDALHVVHVPAVVFGFTAENGWNGIRTYWERMAGLPRPNPGTCGRRAGSHSTIDSCTPLPRGRTAYPCSSAGTFIARPTARCFAADSWI